MRRYICAAMMIFIGATPMVHAGDHKAGDNLKCFYDSNWGHGKWRYYYCGAQGRGCAGKKGNGGQDVHITKYNGESFTFEKGNPDTYWCCGGTTSEAGRFVFGKEFYTSERTERKPLTDGASCNKIIKTTICGTEEEQDCFEPDNCSSGLILRNGECTKPCEEDEAFSSSTSNICVKCETTAYQGTRKKATTINDTLTTEEICVKCDKDTQFFDRTTKACVSKKGSSFIQHTKENIKKCWRCSPGNRLECVSTFTKGNTPTGALKQDCKID